MKYFIQIALSLLLLGLQSARAQISTYIAPSGNMVTHPNAQMAIFGNIINDARGTAAAVTGLNHNGGGTVYLYRRSANGSGNTRIYDGPDNSVYGTGTTNYNAGGKAIRFYNLVTDNNTGTATASGTGINSTSGGGHIQIEQEVCVSGTHTFTNGIIWTPRGAWKHAFLHYDQNGATYTGAGASNTAYTSPATNMQVDGYVAKTGSENFTFPIGDGVYTRFAGLATPTSGTYKAAYFLKNASAGTTGLSGNNATSTIGTGHTGTYLVKISDNEFWDIDGTASSNFALYALNSVAGYSNWSSTFGTGAVNKMSLTGYDPWENLGITATPTAFSNDGPFTTTFATNPDAGNYSAYTWASTDRILPLNLISFSIANQQCTPVLNWTTANEVQALQFEVERSTSAINNFIKVNTISVQSNTSTINSYRYVDAAAPATGRLFYRLKMVDRSGLYTYSPIVSIENNCNDSYNIFVYPNPVADVLKVSGLKGGETIRLYNALGQLVFSKLSSTNVEQLAMKAYSKGMYFLSIYKENQLIHTEKIVNK
jgi:Secretion system C-terminal sorting domain